MSIEGGSLAGWQKALVADIPGGHFIGRPNALITSGQYDEQTVLNMAENILSEDPVQSPWDGAEITTNQVNPDSKSLKVVDDGRVMTWEINPDDNTLRGFDGTWKPADEVLKGFILDNSGKPQETNPLSFFPVLSAVTPMPDGSVVIPMQSIAPQPTHVVGVEVVPGKTVWLDVDFDGLPDRDLNSPDVQAEIDAILAVSSKEVHNCAEYELTIAGKANHNSAYTDQWTTIGHWLPAAIVVGAAIGVGAGMYLKARDTQKNNNVRRTS